MEVHHHSHTARKRWTHYFWEFLMLFLAVFCGFLAEYQLEHKIERDRSKQYIRSFYEDLKINQTTFSRILTHNEIKIAALNNIFPCYDSLSDGNTTKTDCLTNMLKRSSYFLTVAFADGTLEQLKNAGGLRLVNKEDRDSIISYDNYTRNYHEWESSAMQHSQDNVRNSFDELGHFWINKFLYSDSINAAGTPALLTVDKYSVNKIFNVLFRYRQHVARQIQWLTDMRDKTNAVLIYFNVKYHFQ